MTGFNNRTEAQVEPDPTARRIRIAMISDNFAGGTLDGGVQAVTSYLLDEFACFDDVDVHLISFHGGKSDHTRRESDGYTHHLLRTAPLGAVTSYAVDQRALNECLTGIRPDIVHSQGAGKYGILACRSGLPAVITIHGILSEEVRYIANLRARLRHQVLAWQSEYLCIRRAHHFIAISPYVAEYYGSRIRGTSHYIPNPTHPRYFGLPRNEEPGRVLFAGRLVPLKGVMDLVHAIARLEPGVRPTVVLAGAETDRDFARRLRSVVTQLGLEDRVVFAGLMTRDQLAGEFERASCLVLPSYQENAPMVIQEAMASGLPVIASGICGIPYQVKHGETGLLIAPGNVAELAQALETMLRDAPLRRRMGAAARQCAEQSYRADVVARKTVDLYRRILGR